MDVIATWLLALTKNKIPINVRGDPIKSLLYMPGGHRMTIIFLINIAQRHPLEIVAIVNPIVANQYSCQST